MIRKIDYFFRKTKFFRLGLCFIFISIFFSIVYAYLTNLFDNSVSVNSSKIEQNYFFYLLKSAVFAPIIETVLFQFLPIELLRFLKFKSRYTIIIVGLFFGLAHFFNAFLLVDLIFFSCLGSIWCYAYLIIRSRDNGLYLSPLLMVLIHLGYNLFVFTLKYLF